MSSDNYFLIRKHPLGGYAVIDASASDDRAPKARDRHPRFSTVTEALESTYDQYSEYGTSIHDECHAALADERSAANIELFRKALMVEHADDWTMEVISEAAHICARALSL